MHMTGLELRAYALTCVIEFDELVIGHPEFVDEELRMVVAAATKIVLRIAHLIENAVHTHAQPTPSTARRGHWGN